MPKLWRPWAGTPLLYLAIRFLFKFVLKVFYSSIIVENPEFVSSDGTPCILCANHCKCRIRETSSVLCSCNGLYQQPTHLPMLS